MKTVCKYYHTLLAGNSKAGTLHLQKYIEKSWNIIDRASIKKVRSSRTVQRTLKVTTSFDPNATRKELVNMIILHEYPFSIVDHIGF